MCIFIVHSCTTRINIKKGKYAFLRRVNVIFGKPIKYSELGFVNGGRDEYEAATKMIFDEIIQLGDFSALPDYTPDRDINRKKRKKH